MLLNVQGLKITLVHQEIAVKAPDGKTIFIPTEDYAVPGGGRVTMDDITRFVTDPSNYAQIVSTP